MVTELERARRIRASRKFTQKRQAEGLCRCGSPICRERSLWSCASCLQKRKLQAMGKVKQRCVWKRDLIKQLQNLIRMVAKSPCDFNTRGECVCHQL